MRKPKCNLQSTNILQKPTTRSS